MRLFLHVVLFTAAAGIGGTGLGGLLACLFRRDSGKTVSLLLSYAAGVMTGVVCFDLLTDALRPENAAVRVSPLIVAAGVMAGYAATNLLNLWIDSSGRSHRECRRNSLFLAGVVMAAAIALHNLPEGMVIGASFARSAGADLAAKRIVSDPADNRCRNAAADGRNGLVASRAADIDGNLPAHPFFPDFIRSQFHHKVYIQRPQ